MIYSIRKVPFIIIGFLLIAGYILAGTTGKISGRIVDENRSPLPGVNVIIEGTTVGSTTDVNGHYTILNVSPGTYNLKASMVGYQTILVAGIRVNIDQTTSIDFTLKEESILVGEVTIVAERKLVEKDVSASVTSISADEVKALPTNNIMGAVQLQAGVEGGLIIRGGSADQSLFLVDGFALRDARNNQPVTQVALSSVQNFSLERGGFNAEYGQVRSGILNIVTKDGSKSGYEVSFTTRISPASKKYFDISPFDPNSMLLRPYLDPAVAFVGTENGTWDEFTRKQYPQFDGWNALSKSLFEDNDPANDLTPQALQRLFQWQHRRRPSNKPDYDIDFGFGGPVPLLGRNLGDMTFFFSYRRNREMLIVPLTRDDYFEDNFSLKLTSNITPSIKLTASGLYGGSENVALNGTERNLISGTGPGGVDNVGIPVSTDYIRTPSQIASVFDNQYGSSINILPSRLFSDGYYSLAKLNHFGLGANLTYVYSANTFSNITIDYFERKYDTGPTRLRNEQPVYELFPGYFVNEAPFGAHLEAILDAGVGDGMFIGGGHTSTARDSSKTSSLTFKADLTTQFNFNNQVKTGIEFVYNNLDLNFGNVSPEFPNENNYIKEKFNPLRAAFYIQDKLEFEGFIANLGVRLDYSNSNQKWVYADPFDYSFFGSGYSSSLAYPTQSSKGKFYISPRIGISHPITENSKLYFNYGHFRQLPGYEQAFQRTRTQNKMAIYGDPNLPLAKTVSYELGYDQVLLSNFLLQVSGFYRDISDQIAVTRYLSADGRVLYNGVNSNNYQDSRGFEVTLRKSQGSWIKGFLTYTYQVTSQGRFYKDYVFEDPSAQRQFDQNTGNFLQNKPIPQPYSNGVFTFSTPKDFGPSFLKNNLLGDLNLTLIATWRAGFWTTWNPKNKPFVNQNLQGKDYYNIDLRLSKDLDFGDIVLTLLVDANNVLNLRRFSGFGFADNFDFLDYMNSLHLPKSDVYGNISGDDTYGDFRKPDVDFQPIIQVENTGSIDPSSAQSRPFYYENSTGRYMQISGNGSWVEVDPGKLDQVLKDKAYIDMPNFTTFTFLNPRNVFFGIQASIKL